MVLLRELIRFGWLLLPSSLVVFIFTYSSFLDPVGKVTDEWTGGLILMVFPALAILFCFDLTHSYFGKTYREFVRSKPAFLWLFFLGGLLGRVVLWIAGTYGVLFLLSVVEQFLEGASLPWSAYGERFIWSFILGLLILTLASVMGSWRSPLMGVVSGLATVALILLAGEMYDAFFYIFSPLIYTGITIFFSTLFILILAGLGLLVILLLLRTIKRIKRMKRQGGG